MSTTNWFDLTKFFYEFIGALQATGRIRMAKCVIHFMMNGTFSENIELRTHLIFL